ncbi:MAG TPA: ribose-5-phosphate isomerase RpiA [Terriglobales bacterium]|jgi:ribose 5-phosphate isomerase A|nr:ribose-5-phosphate isomerase RpiA [Terriglobales bacterium]
MTVPGKEDTPQKTDLRDQEKQAAARAAVELVESGNIVGLGSGSTAAHAVRFLAERVRAGLSIVGIPTSQQTMHLAEQLGIQLTTLDQHPHIDIDIDGADEIDPQLNLIKGGGGAFLREKIVASVSRRFIVIADSAKQVKRLGKFPLPVEVVPFAQSLVKPRIEALGAEVTLRCYAYGNPYVTDEGHHILDCHFGEIADPPALADELRCIPGVLEHGLFIGMAEMALVGKSGQVIRISR